MPPPVQLLLERFLAIEANMAAPPIMVRGELRELLSGTLLVAGGEVQIWQGGAWGRWRREVGVLGFFFKIFKLEGRSSQVQSLSLFQI